MTHFFYIHVLDLIISTAAHSGGGEGHKYLAETSISGLFQQVHLLDLVIIIFFFNFEKSVKASKTILHILFSRIMLALARQQDIPFCYKIENYDKCYLPKWRTKALLSKDLYYTNCPRTWIILCKKILYGGISTQLSNYYSLL